MEKTIELVHEDITLRASPKTIIDALLQRLSVRKRGPVLGSVSDIPAVGELWPEQGGWRAAEIRGEGILANYDLILVQGDDGNPIVIEDVEWGEYGKEIKGADHLRDGFANTEAMSRIGNSLAKRIGAISASGHFDLYLPSIVELQAIWGNLGEHLPKKVFWSSTQGGANSARCQGFEYGSSGWDGKISKFHALVVRRVLR